MEADAAYLLVAHGSRDRRSQLALQQLGQLFQHSLPPSGPSGLYPWVATGTLEFGPVSLEQQIGDWAKILVQQQVPRLYLLPLFLLPGRHVQVDLPAVLSMVAAGLKVSLPMELRSHLGSHPGITSLLGNLMQAQQLDHGAIDQWILLAHGSRYPGGNQPVEQLAHQLGAVTAYWSGPPSLLQRVEELSQKSIHSIGIQPYFLFSGSIMDAISKEIDQLKCSFYDIEFSLSSPLQPTPQLVQLIQALLPT